MDHFTPLKPFLISKMKTTLLLFFSLFLFVLFCFVLMTWNRVRVMNKTKLMNEFKMLNKLKAMNDLLVQLKKKLKLIKS